MAIFQEIALTKKIFFEEGSHAEEDEEWQQDGSCAHDERKREGYRSMNCPTWNGKPERIEQKDYLLTTAKTVLNPPHAPKANVESQQSVRGHKNETSEHGRGN